MLYFCVLGTTLYRLLAFCVPCHLTKLIIIVIIIIHIEQLKNKALHGQWPKLMDELNADSYRWLCNAYFNPATESLLIAAQDQALNTNWLSCHVHHTVSSDLCRQCRMYPKTIEHIIAGCPTMVQTVYLDRHNAVTSAIH